MSSIYEVDADVDVRKNEIHGWDECYEVVHRYVGFTMCIQYLHVYF
jgi:hypothetical protein